MFFVRRGSASSARSVVVRGLPRARAAANKHAGAQFEKLFVHRATLGGLLAQKNELSFRYQGGGKMLPIRTDLDFRVSHKSGVTAFLDTKSFDGDYFTYSQIDRHQLARARHYEAFNVPSGFVVWLKGVQTVMYYTGSALHQLGPRSRFNASNGVLLGTPMTFDLTLVFLAHAYLK